MLRILSRPKSRLAPPKITREILEKETTIRLNDALVVWFLLPLFLFLGDVTASLSFLAPRFSRIHLMGSAFSFFLGIFIASLVVGFYRTFKDELGFMVMGGGVVALSAMGLSAMGWPEVLVDKPLEQTVWSLYGLLFTAGLGSAYYLLSLLRELHFDRNPIGKAALLGATFCAGLGLALLWNSWGWSNASGMGLWATTFLLVSAMSFYFTSEYFWLILIPVVWRLFYRMDWRGVENLPKPPFIVASNHVSYADFVLIGSPLSQPVRMLMDHSYIPHFSRRS